MSLNFVVSLVFNFYSMFNYTKKINDHVPSAFAVHDAVWFIKPSVYFKLTRCLLFKDFKSHKSIKSAFNRENIFCKCFKIIHQSSDVIELDISVNKKQNAKIENNIKK